MKRNFIAKRFQNAGTGLTLDTAALAKYKDIVDLSIGDTDFTTDEAIINAAFRDAKAGYTHYGDPKGDPELISAVCKAWEEDFDQSLPRDHVLVSASSCLGMALTMLAILNPGWRCLPSSTRATRSSSFPRISRCTARRSSWRAACASMCRPTPRRTMPSAKSACALPSRRARRPSFSITPRTPPAWATTCPPWRCLPAWRRNMIFSSRRTKFTRPTSTRATSAPSVHCPAWPSAPSRSTAFPKTS